MKLLSGATSANVGKIPKDSPSSCKIFPMLKIQPNGFVDKNAAHLLDVNQCSRLGAWIRPVGFKRRGRGGHLLVVSGFGGVAWGCAVACGGS